MFSTIIPTWNNRQFVHGSFVYHFSQVSVNRIVKNDGCLQFLHKWGISQRDSDQICPHRGEPVELDTALAGRTLDADDRAHLAKARLRARFTLKFKPAAVFAGDTLTR